jgi:ribose transport system substrate-binding protein
MGYLGVKSLVDHLRGQPVEAYVDTGVTVKTAANTSAQ